MRKTAKRREPVATSADPTLRSGSRATESNGTGGRRHLSITYRIRPNKIQAMTDKKLLRKQYLATRQRMTDAACQANSKTIAEAVFASDKFLSATKIAVYLSQGKEVNTTRIIEEAWHQNKKVYVPVINKDKTMRFVIYNLETRLEQNFFGIAEPVLQPKTEIAVPEELDLVFFPLLAFDKNGNRLGMGGGYYDRYFSFTNSAHLRKTVTLIALAHACQEHQNLPFDPWDVALDFVFTENQSFAFAG